MTPSNTKLKVKLAPKPPRTAPKGKCITVANPSAKLVHAVSGTGFSLELCERHTERLARHGHPSIPSIPGPMLRPYVRPQGDG